MKQPAHAFDIVGRDELLRLTADVTRGAEGAPTALVLTGEAGIGKSTLLRHAVSSASGPDLRVLFAAGGEPTLLEAYSSIAELIWPIREFAAVLPAVLSATVAELLGIAATTSPRGPLHIRQAVFALLQTASEATPLVIAIDDFDRIDHDSRDVLAYVIGRLIGTQMRALLTARSSESLHGIDRAIPTIEVPRLADTFAAALVGAQAQQPAVSVRGEIIRWSAGNPLALIESARAYGRSGATTFRGHSVAGAGGAYALFAHQLTGLPPDTRKLMLYAAAGAGYETVEAIAAAAGLGCAGPQWEPAVSAGLLQITDDRHVQFRHPLIRTAAYSESASDERHAAHLALARSPQLSPPCRAWHMASAASGPDESIAAALETSSSQSQRRGGYLEVARALQRAAELSPDRDDAARRYGLAAAAANFGGDPAWALTLSDNVTQATDDTYLRGYATLTRASILMQSAQPLEAFSLIHGVLSGPNPPEGNLALDLVYLAASASYYTGEQRHRRPLRRWLEQASRSAGTGRQLPTQFPADCRELQRAYVQMYADTPDSPHGRPGGLEQRWLQPGLASAEPYRRLVTGVAGYATENSAMAARDLTNAVDLLKAGGGLRGFTYAIAPLAWTLLDTGRWSTLSDLLDETATLCAVQDLGLLELETSVCRAQLLALQGDQDGAAAALVRARREARPAGACCATEVALWRAAGWQAVAAGDYDGAYRYFRQMFRPDGEPVHFVVSHRGVADLAWAAARSGRTEEGQPVIAAIGRQLGSNPPVRLRLLRHHALALVATTTRVAEQHFRLAVFDPAGDEWPIERARARLHYGEWLRRARRPGEARPLLTAALEVFERLGARPLAEIANAELRASGITSTAAPATDAFDALTAQEQQIVILAASGLTNREIADRLNLSPRTIGSHLYHVYPKLGVSRRHELREFAP